MYVNLFSRLSLPSNNPFSTDLLRRQFLCCYADLPCRSLLKLEGTGTGSRRCVPNILAYILSFAVLVLCSACFWFWWLVGVAILSKNEITFLFDIYFIVSVLVIVWFIALSKLCCLQVSRKLQARLGGAIIVFIPLMKLQVVFPQILCSLLKLLKSSLTYLVGTKASMTMAMMT